MTEDERAGVRAIIELQAAAGIVEAEEMALLGWRAMSETERRMTLLTYRVIVRAPDGPAAPRLPGGPAAPRLPGGPAGTTRRFGGRSSIRSWPCWP